MDVDNGVGVDCGSRGRGLGGGGQRGEIGTTVMEQTRIKKKKKKQSGPSSISSTHLAPYKVMTTLLTIFPMLYFTSL